MKLKLQNVGQEVAHVGHIGRHVVLGAWIEILFRSPRRRRDALILQPKLPPGLSLYFSGGISPEKTFQRH